MTRKIKGLIGSTPFLFLFGIKPAKKRYSFKDNLLIAHRGLFNNNDIPENSMKAFEKAIEKNYGIELDVHITKDKKIVVHHDDNLKRICNIDKKIKDIRYNEIKKYNLLSTEEKIPLLSEVLKKVNGKVPLIIEIKADYIKYKEICIEVAKLLDKYTGKFFIESFHPLVLQWFKKNRPEIIRGQLSMNYSQFVTAKTFIPGFILTNLLMNFLSKPDFIAYNHKDTSNFSLKLCKRIFKVSLAAWTIKTEEDIKKLKNDFNIFIFEGFEPKLNKNCLN